MKKENKEVNNTNEVKENNQETAFVCKACGVIGDYTIVRGDRKKCMSCGKVAKKKLSDVLYSRFHPEITTEPLKREKIMETDIIIYDSSEPMKNRKSKYNSKSCIILFKYDVDCLSDDRIKEIKKDLEGLSNDKQKFDIEDKLLCWISGTVLVDQLQDLQEKKLLPDRDGLETKLTVVETDDGTYYKFD